MTNYDAQSEEEERHTEIEFAADAELEELFPPPPPERSQILDGEDSEALASWNLRRIRTALGISQQQISDKLAELRSPVRLSQSQIAKIERGERPWRVNEMMEIARALGIGFLEFFSGQMQDDDEEAPLFAAYLRLDRARNELDEIREEWRAAAKKVREAEEIFLKLAAETALRKGDLDVREVAWTLERRFDHQGYLEEVKKDLDESLPGYWPSKEEREERDKARKAYARAEWERYLREAASRNSDNASSSEE